MSSLWYHFKSWAFGQHHHPPEDAHDQPNKYPDAPVSPPQGQDTPATSAAAGAPHTGHELPPETQTTPPISSPKGKAPETGDPDALDSVFDQAWDDLHGMSDKEVAQRTPWHTNVSNSGVSPSKAGQLFESMEKD